MTDFKDFEWVVWCLEVQDPSQLAGEDPDLDERTQEAMTELAASLGCVYDSCVDYDSYDDETPYYAWWVRLPAAEHARLDQDGLPLAIGPLRQYLTTQLPDGLKWEITPDRELTYDHAGSEAMRSAYDDLIAPFERALMPLRLDGADELDPRAKVWKWEENLLVGTFDLWLCDDPDRPHTWIVEGPTRILRPVIRVHDRSIETAAGSLGGCQGVDDELGAHVIGDRPPGQPA